LLSSFSERQRCSAIHPHGGRVYHQFVISCFEHLFRRVFITIFSECMIIDLHRRPNTALEPTADVRFSLAGSVGFAMRQFGGGSAFIR
jgi:hypothetical protein